MKKIQLAFAAAATLVATQAAHATITASYSVGGGAPNHATKYDLEGLGTSGGIAGNLTVSFPTGDGKMTTGSSSGQYAAPHYSGANDTGFLNGPAGPDSSKYLTTGTGSALLTFVTPQSYLGLVWGSVDSYNTITFYNGDTPLGTFQPSSAPGAAIPLPAPGGDQGAAGTYWVDFHSDTGFNKVVLSSTSKAFEIDNIATAVPEPSTYIAGALLLVPFAAGAIRSVKNRQKS